MKQNVTEIRVQRKGMNPTDYLYCIFVRNTAVTTVFDLLTF